MNKPDQPKRDPNLDPTLIAAVAAGDALRVASLLDGGASPNAQLTEKLGENWWSETPALYIACAKKLEAIVALLLDRGADPNAYLYRYENMLQ
jgi:ankyrin repeat protein